ncbi:MAG: hypothetical protein ACREMA_03210, partial [Longimicrobiales bacterium]
LGPALPRLALLYLPALLIRAIHPTFSDFLLDQTGSMAQAWALVANLVLYLWVAIVFLTAIALPLSDFLASFDPAARHRLEPDAVRVAQACLSITALGLFGAVIGVATLGDGWWFVVLCIGFLVIPVVAVGRPEVRGPTGLDKMYGMVVAFMVPLMAYQPTNWGRLVAGGIILLGVWLSWLRFQDRDESLRSSIRWA